VAEITVKILLCCGFRRNGKAMGQVTILMEDMSRNKCFFQVRISHVSRLISISDLFTDSSSYMPLKFPFVPHRKHMLSLLQGQSVDAA
jgi:hypothetical protein